MSACVQKQSIPNTDRLIRMQKLISHEQCRSVMRAPGWSLPDRFLYRGMRAMLFHRDLETLRQSAKKALLQAMNSDGDLSHGPLIYLRIELLIWSLRLGSVAFVLGFNVNADSKLELLFPVRPAALR